MPLPENLDDGLEAEPLGAEVRDGVLYLGYALRNESPETVRLGGRLSRGALHTSLAPGPILLVRRPLGEAPAELAPGQRFEDALELPLPVAPRHPLAPQPEAAPHEIGQVALAVDYRLGDDRIKMLGPAGVAVLTTIALR
jgi:hypothetical protein